MSYNLNFTALSRYGGWFPSCRLVHEGFLDTLTRKAVASTESRIPPSKYTPSVTRFKDAITADFEMVDLFKEMLLQVPPEKAKVHSFDELLAMLDLIIIAPPKFDIAVDANGNEIGEPIGVPIYLLFDLLSNTSAGYDLFRKRAFNDALKDLLDDWGRYLTSSDSNKSLTAEKEGWFSPAALAVLESKDRGTFNATYQCPSPNATDRGFTSWDAFFTRKLQPGVRPIEASEDKNLIHNACESTVYRISEGIKARDRFWLKGQPYSLANMLDDLDLAKQFAGGTIYQAFLSPQDYHRWHSPIDGTIVATKIIPGSYYAALPDAGAEEGDPYLKPGDPHGAIIRSQAWITHSAARAVVYIEADNPVIGLVAFMAVGMVEVSTCEVTVREGQRVVAGEELGMFHFGGSSHTLIFGPNVKIAFADHVKPNVHLKVNSVIAQAGRCVYRLE